MRILFLLVLLTSALHAQGFEVATIKPSAPDTARATMIRGNQFLTTGTTALDMLVYAYNIHPSQLVGGPEWLRTSKFDVLADPLSEKRPTSPEMKAMVAKLMTERFHLVMHHETKELPVYAILPGSKALTLTVSQGNERGIPTGGFTPPGTLAVRNGTVANFAAFLQRYATADLDRPVVDQTGIAGVYDFDLSYTPANAAPETRADAAPKPGIFTAMQEQLGLKLKATRAGVDVLMVDSASMPTPD